MCNETEKHRRWKRYRYFIASLSFSTTIAPASRLGVLPPGNQCSQFPTRPCELVPGLRPQTRAGPSLGEHWGVFGGRWRGDGALGVGSRTDVHSWWARGWVASGRALLHVLSLLVTGLDPALCQPPRGSIPELGGGRAGCGRTQLPHAHLCVQGMGEEGGHTQGTLLVVSTRGKERARGFKNKRICSALLKIEKVALKSSPTKGLKVKQAPNRERLSAK